MFFLLRMTFWLFVVCVLLPGSGSKTPEANIDTASAVSAASAAVSDMRSFCERQPAACDVGGKVAVALGHKAESGARTLIEFVTNRMHEPQATPAADTAGHQPLKTTPVKTIQASNHGQDIVTGTLTPTDLTAPWHAPVPLPPRREARAGRPSV